MKKALIVSVLAVGALVGLMFSNFGTNLWGVITGRGFMIPAESSIFSFKVTVMNEGSGEWWLYGEDRDAFYAFTGAADRPYVRMTRAAAAKCAGFQPHELSTWCQSPPPT
jgi:hypothetical protein